MASIFRTVKHEDMIEFTKWSKIEKGKVKTKKDKEKELLRTDVENPLPDDDEEKPKPPPEETKTGGDVATGDGGTT